MILKNSGAITFGQYRVIPIHDIFTKAQTLEAQHVVTNRYPEEVWRIR